MVVNVRIKIPDQVAARAKARGISVEAYIQEILEQQVTDISQSRLRTPDEIRAWLDALAQFSDKIPPLPDVISHDWLYQDHD